MRSTTLRSRRRIASPESRTQAHEAPLKVKGEMKTKARPAGPATASAIRGEPLPHEARHGLMRAWLEILRARHPGLTWVPARDDSRGGEDATRGA